MDKLSKALNQQNQSLSNADFRKGIDNNDQKPVINLQAQINKALAKKKQNFWEAREQEKREDLERLKKSYEHKLTKADNLGIAYALLLGKEDIYLPFKFNQQAFLEVVSDTFADAELEFLAERIYKIHDNLNDKINKIKSGNDLDLYHQYHKYSKDFEEIDNQSNQPTRLACKVETPIDELRELENERDVYTDLQAELEKLINYEPKLHSYSFERIQQALA